VGLTGAATSWPAPVVTESLSDETCISNRSVAHSIAQIRGFRIRGERLGYKVRVVQVKRFDLEQTMRTEPSRDDYIL